MDPATPGRDRPGAGLVRFGRPAAGRVWHHALHARACIERGRHWQAAAPWISALRDQVLTLACLRPSGYPASYAGGAHLLPPAS